MQSVQGVCAAVCSYLRQRTVELCWKMYVSMLRIILIFVYVCTYLSGVHVEGETHTPFTILKVEVLKSVSLGLMCPSWSFCGFLLQEVGEVVRLLNSKLSVTAEPAHPIPVLTVVCGLT